MRVTNNYDIDEILRVVCILEVLAHIHLEIMYLSFTENVKIANIQTRHVISILVMRSLHDVHKMNACMAGHVSLSLSQSLST
jgi:hypothetical protein